MVLRNHVDYRMPSYITVEQIEANHSPFRPANTDIPWRYDLPVVPEVEIYDKTEGSRLVGRVCMDTIR
jgi:hypothetical protein